MNHKHIQFVQVVIDNAKYLHPTWPADNVKRSAIVIEEAGEMVREANLLDEGKGDIERLRNEIIQMIGTGFRFLEELDKDDRD